MSSKFHLSFKTKLIIIICLFNIFAIVAVSYFNYQRSSEQLITVTIKQTQQIIEQIGTNIDTYLAELYRLTLTPYYNDNILNNLETAPKNSEEQLKIGREMDEFLSGTMILPRNEILRVYLMNTQNIYSYTRTPYEMPDYDTYTSTTWYQQALETSRPIYIPPHLEKAFGEKTTPVFSIVRSLYSKKNNDKLIGVIKVDADYTGIKKICDSFELNKESELLIVNDKNQIIYQTYNLSTPISIEEIQKALIETDTFFQTLDGKDYILNSYSISSSGLRILTLSSYQELMQPVIDNLQKTVFLALLFIILTVTFFTFFIKRFLSPLSEIIYKMREVEKGNLDIQITPKNPDEIGFLAISFNNMISNLRQFIDKNTQLIKKVYETQYLYKESQYNALCSQIKPHFMYNTLNTISLLIKCNENQKAIHTIESFSHYLGGIMNTDKEITLNEEIQICKSYLSIMQLRHEDKLTYHIQIDDCLYNHKIPSLSLQTIVENAVKYGCKPKRGKTTILLTSSLDLETDSYHIIISDNGMGMDFVTLENVNRRISDIHQNHENTQTNLLGNIGLINVCKRLFLKFGLKADLKIQSDYGEGTTVTLTLPMNENVKD